jgi:hypothetical protein
MNQKNKEQLEAEEIESLPRIVITAKKFFVFNKHGESLDLGIDDLQAMLRLSHALALNDKANN